MEIIVDICFFKDSVLTLQNEALDKEIALYTAQYEAETDVEKKNALTKKIMECMTKKRNAKKAKYSLSNGKKHQKQAKIPFFRQNKEKKDENIKYFPFSPCDGYGRCASDCFT